MNNKTKSIAFREHDEEDSLGSGIATVSPEDYNCLLNDYTHLTATPQSEHNDCAYVASFAGVFARFYGPRANEWMHLFLSTLRTGELGTPSS